MWKYTELSYYLAALYRRADDTDDIIEKAGVKSQFVPFSNRATTYWGNILRYMENKGTVRNLVLTVLNDDHETDPYLLAFRDDEQTNYQSPYSNTSLDKPVEPTEKQLEKLTMEASTFLPVSFLSVGVEKAKSVVKIIRPGGGGTGFILNNHYLLTNNHVIKDIEVARNEKTNFLCNFEEGKQEEIFKLTPDVENGFATSVKNDWTIVKIAVNNEEEERKLAAYGHLPLEEIVVKKDDFVNIIQHPEGNKKQIAIYHNLVVGVDDTRVQYLTDTLPGSSGSPVFNSNWQIVALHHAGGELIVKGTNNKALVNEGIHINLVRAEITQNGIIL